MLVNYIANITVSKYSDLLKDAVRRRLAEQDLSQNELGARIGVSSAEISNWISGKTAIRFERVGDIAQALGLEPWELLKPEAAQPSPAPVTRESLIARIVLALHNLDDSELLDLVTLAEGFPAARPADTSRKLRSNSR